MEAKICSCGMPQSYPIPHEHDMTDREKSIRDASFKAGYDLAGKGHRLKFYSDHLDFHRGVGAGIKKMLEWGNEVCTDHFATGYSGGNNRLRRECPECWQVGLEEWE